MSNSLALLRYIWSLRPSGASAALGEKGSMCPAWGDVGFDSQKRLDVHTLRSPSFRQPKTMEPGSLHAAAFATARRRRHGCVRLVTGWRWWGCRLGAPWGGLPWPAARGGRARAHRPCRAPRRGPTTGPHGGAGHGRRKGGRRDSDSAAARSESKEEERQSKEEERQSKEEERQSKEEERRSKEEERLAQHGAAVRAGWCRCSRE